MDFDNLAFQLLMEMRKTPLATLSDFADRLGVASNTIKARQEYLKEHNFIRSNEILNDQLLGERQISAVVAHHSSIKLGLLRVHVIFEDPQDFSTLFSIIDKHHYTYYQTPGMAYTRLIYAIFDIPPQSVDQMIEFFDRLKISDLCRNYVLIDPVYQTKSDDNLELWREYPNWDITIDTQINQHMTIDESFENYKDTTTQLKSTEPPRSTPALDELDLRLIRELTINSKVTPTSLSQWYNRDRTTLSRRLNRIRKNYIKDYSLLYNRKIFNLDSIFLIYGQVDTFTGRALFKLIDEGIIPYKSNYFLDRTGNFIWHLFAPPSFCNEVVHSLLKSLPSLHLMLLNQSEGVRYYFYPDNYDVSSKSWKTDKQYIINLDTDY